LKHEDYIQNNLLRNGLLHHKKNFIIYSFFSDHLGQVAGLINNPHAHFPKTHYSSMPTFQL